MYAHIWHTWAKGRGKVAEHWNDIVRCVHFYCLISCFGEMEWKCPPRLPHPSHPPCWIGMGDNNNSNGVGRGTRKRRTKPKEQQLFCGGLYCKFLSLFFFMVLFISAFHGGYLCRFISLHSAMQKTKALVLPVHTLKWWQIYTRLVFMQLFWDGWVFKREEIPSICFHCSFTGLSPFGL